MTSKILITPLALRSASAFWHSVKSGDDIPPAKIIFTVDITSRMSKLKSSFTSPERLWQSSHSSPSPSPSLSSWDGL